MAEKLRVLAVGAHPDDLELCCAGTLARFAQEGHHVTMCYVCRGDAASHELAPEEIARIRSEEACRSAEIIGAELIAGLGLGDGEVYVQQENTMKFLDLIRRTRPDLVITHNLEDYLQDHYNTARLVFEASLFSTTENIRSNYPAHPVVPSIYHMQTYTGVNFCPEEYVDITETFEIKSRMLSCHKSQVEFMIKHFGDDMLEAISVEGRFWGRQAGVRYAEGFVPHRSYPRIKTRRLLP
ncbi:MAG TPA: PIG-L family deacetylase [Atribacteraceae bacterium]|nr:PIG-L family deacetylase [Atribacteraceae bacterium]